MKKTIYMMLSVVVLAVSILILLPGNAKADAAVGGGYNFKEANYNVVVDAPDYYVNFRVGPGLEYPARFQISNGEILHIRRTADNYFDNLKWGMTEFQGELGWVSLSQTTRIGWVKSGSKWYYIGSDGNRKTGWLKSGGKWYYMDSSGAMKTGWVRSGGKWYYMTSSGAMKTGWVRSGGKWYYMGSNGAMKTGWVKSGGKWYYMNSSGVMQTGWVWIGNQRYHFNSDGVWDR